MNEEPEKWLNTVHGVVKFAETTPLDAVVLQHPDDAKVLAELYPGDRERYARGEFKIGTVVRRRMGEFSAHYAVKGFNPLYIVPVMEF